MVKYLSMAAEKPGGNDDLKILKAMQFAFPNLGITHETMRGLESNPPPDFTLTILKSLNQLLNSFTGAKGIVDCSILLSSHTRWEKILLDHTSKTGDGRNPAVILEELHTRRIHRGLILDGGLIVPLTIPNPDQNLAKEFLNRVKGSNIALIPGIAVVKADDIYPVALEYASLTVIQRVIPPKRASFNIK